MVTQEGHENNLFNEDKLFFSAEHERPMVSVCRRTAFGDGSGWVALHRVVDDFDFGTCDKTVTAGLLLNSRRQLVQGTWAGLTDSGLLLWFRRPERDSGLGIVHFLFIFCHI